MIEPTVKVNPHEIIFSLDIGTRSIIGIVGKREKDKFIVVDAEVMEHPSRTMYDGQIHDIEKVARVAKQVKENLEKRLGVTLRQVAIAAAGRALKTYRLQISREIDSTKKIDQAMIHGLEMEGVQVAQERLDKEMNLEDTKYYCVGYTAISYYLDDHPITSLKEHRGNKIGIDMLATFLPHVVIDSLYTVMHKIGLEVIHLTLEPIAAIHIAIPPKLRLLNLALVDIGAGTSDIALTQDGMIIGYGMASVAGDEITEAIAKEFLLDFDTAEHLKLQLNQKDEHTFEDIVGTSYTMRTAEILNKVSTAISNWASEVAKTMIAYNGKPPSAVFCIGGGSKIPTITDHLAEKLGIKNERVVVRGTEILEEVEFQCKQLEGPEFITPIGVGSISIKNEDKNFIQVLVNGNPIQLFKAKQLLISDAFIHSGFSARKLICRKGKNLNIMINGSKKTIYGDAGQPAKIYLNGQLSSLEEQIKDQDRIDVQEAINGEDVCLCLKDLVKTLKIVNFNDIDIALINHLKVNDQTVSMEYILKENDRLTFTEINKVEELLKKFNMEGIRYCVEVNGIEVGKDCILNHGDKIVTYTRKKPLLIIDQKGPKDSKEDYGSMEGNAGITVWVNNKPIHMSDNGKTPIFIDIFNYIDLDIIHLQGNFSLLLNGKRANYTDPLKDGDRIAIG
jgi:cell division protein FtsA